MRETQATCTAAHAPASLKLGSSSVLAAGWLWLSHKYANVPASSAAHASAFSGFSTSRVLLHVALLLFRRERAELEAEVSGSSDAQGAGGVASDEEEDTTYQKNLLEESRRVEEFERLNRISGEFVCVCMHAWVVAWVDGCAGSGA